MPSKPVDEAELRRLCEKLTLTVIFIRNAQDFPMAQEILRLVNTASDRRDLRTLRLLHKEVEAMTAGLSRDELDGLDALLNARLGIDKDAERCKARDKVATILERGTVASEKERQRLSEYATMLEITGGDAAELEAVRALIVSG